ncbi:hypothetical protein [Agathobacter sp.]
MRLKNFSALVLSGAMIAGTVGMMNPAMVMADDTGVVAKNTYTLSVPADLSIKNAGWNKIGNIAINKNSDFDSGKTVTVKAASANEFNLVSGENKISYTMKESQDGEEKTTFTFDSEAINAGTASQAVGVDVADFSDNVAGTYTDTIIYEASMSGSGSGEEKATINDLFKAGAKVEIGAKTSDGNAVSMTVVAGEETDGKYEYEAIEADQSKVYKNYGTYASQYDSCAFKFDMMLKDGALDFNIYSDGSVVANYGELQYIKIDGKLFYGSVSGDDSGDTGSDLGENDYDKLAELIKEGADLNVVLKFSDDTTQKYKLTKKSSDTYGDISHDYTVKCENSGSQRVTISEEARSNYSSNGLVVLNLEASYGDQKNNWQINVKPNHYLACSYDFGIAEIRVNGVLFKKAE